MHTAVQTMEAVLKQSFEQKKGMFSVLMSGPTVRSVINQYNVALGLVKNSGVHAFRLDLDGPNAGETDSLPVVKGTKQTISPQTTYDLPITQFANTDPNDVTSWLNTAFANRYYPMEVLVHRVTAHAAHALVAKDKNFVKVSDSCAVMGVMAQFMTIVMGHVVTTRFQEPADSKNFYGHLPRTLINSQIQKLTADELDALDAFGKGSDSSQAAVADTLKGVMEKIKVKHNAKIEATLCYDDLLNNELALHSYFWFKENDRMQHTCGVLHAALEAETKKLLYVLQKDLKSQSDTSARGSSPDHTTPVIQHNTALFAAVEARTDDPINLGLSVGADSKLLKAALALLNDYPKNTKCA